jgi:hypothetical protein
MMKLESHHSKLYDLFWIPKVILRTIRLMWHRYPCESESRQVIWCDLFVKGLDLIFFLQKDQNKKILRWTGLARRVAPAPTVTVLIKFCSLCGPVHLFGPSKSVPSSDPSVRPLNRAGSRLGSLSLRFVELWASPFRRLSSPSPLLHAAAPTAVVSCS